MIPIKFQTESELQDIKPEELQNIILEICQSHHKENKALAFAFIFFDFDNPQISKVLSDINYWKALNKISGKFLSVFHLHTSEDFFAEDLKKFNDNDLMTKNLYNTGISPSKIAKLKHFIEPTESIKTPSILFFQTNGTVILDSFIVELKEEKTEESFLEIKDYIKSAVDSLLKVTPENKDNRQPIFDLIESNVQSKQFKRNFSRKVQTFPLNLLLGWLVGKM
jgi:hypothetical protein